MESVDYYCERLAPGAWAEPVNAITNFGFVLVGLLICWRATRPNQRIQQYLGVCIVLVGLGSLAFHHYGTRATEALDVGFIALYLVSFAALVPARLWPAPEAGPAARVGLAMVGVGILMALVVGIQMATPAIRAAGLDWFPPGFYVGAWLSLLVFAIVTALRPRIRAAARPMLWAAAVFPVSLAARQLDLPLCESVPVGLHFLWHLLNACVLGLTAAAFRCQPAAHSPASRLSPLS